MPSPISAVLMRLSTVDEPNAPWCWSEWQTLSSSTLAPWQALDPENPGTYIVSTWDQDSVQKVAAFRERYVQLCQSKQADKARKFLGKPLAEDGDTHLRGRALWDIWVKTTKQKVKFIDEYSAILLEAGVDLAAYLADTNDNSVCGSISHVLLRLITCIDTLRASDHDAGRGRVRAVVFRRSQRRARYHGIPEGFRCGVQDGCSRLVLGSGTQATCRGAEARQDLQGGVRRNMDL